MSRHRSGPTRSRFARLFLLAAAVFAVAELGAWATGWRALELFARLAAICWGLVALAWVGRALWRRVFWSVGRRLALSYVLVGVLPLALIALLGVMAAYLLGGFLLGHLARDAVGDLRDELAAAAAARLEDAAAATPALRMPAALRFAEYRHGRRVGGAEPAPPAWPAWLASVQAEWHVPGSEERRRPFVALPDGSLSVAAAAGDAEHGVVAWLEGDLAAGLRERTRTWFELFRADDPRQLPATRLQLGGRVIVLRGLWLQRDPAETAEFYRLAPPADPGSPSWLERPVILWMEQAGTVRALGDGGAAADGVSISLAASPRGLFRSLLSTSEQADSTAWLALAGLSVLLFEIWIVAAGVAVFMIYGLSRAVNRLTHATAALGRGDFSFRVPVRRSDQVGDLQRSFNAMAEHLAELVETAAQKEALDKELALARRVQQDLLPSSIVPRAGVDIAAFFEPSAAIGGDYYDVLERPGGKLAIVVADVAGHGLAAGLRMAVVKSALTLLAEEGRPAEEIFARLLDLIRRRPQERSFVTLSLADFDPATGTLELTNAGHPPCYVVRDDGTVEEVIAPGMPLGALAGAPGRASLRLARGEGVVFLSDGFVECRDGGGELFGFEGVRRCLRGPSTSAAELLARLLAGVRTHCGQAPAEDDRTAVALVYRDPAATTGSSPSRA